MGKRAKTSRKGKKAWRANISSKDIEDFYEKSTKDALSGGSLSSAPRHSLFIVDQATGIYFYSFLLFHSSTLRYVFRIFCVQLADALDYFLMDEGSMVMCTEIEFMGHLVCSL